MKKKRLAGIMMVIVMFGTPVGCASQTFATRTVANLDGDQITVPETIDSIAAIYGPSYEALVVLGAEDKIKVCADVQVEDFPWARKVFSQISQLPCLENVHYSVNIEELLTYKTDLIFTFPRPNEEKKLEEAGTSYIAGKTTQTLEDTPNYLMVYAQALGGDAVEKATEYQEYFNEKLAYIKHITDTISEDERPVVYYAGTDLLTTYGNLSDIPELIEAAGGIAATQNLAAGNRTQINYEEFVNYNPDYIFIDHGGIDDSETVEQIENDTYSDGRYSTVLAVQNRQIYLVPSGVFYWDMGLQKIMLLMYMAQILHPDLFSDMDMVSEVQNFYQKFFDYTLTQEEAQKIINRQDL